MRLDTNLTNRPLILFGVLMLLLVNEFTLVHFDPTPPLSDFAVLFIRIFNALMVCVIIFEKFLWKNIVSLMIILVSSIIGIIIFEVALQILKKNDKWDVTKKANIVRNLTFDYDISDLYDSNLKTVRYFRNQYGLRDDCNDPSEIKILTVGGSTTDQRYVHLQSTYQKILQNRIEEKIGKPVCVSNAGVSGHSTFGHIFALENWFPLIPNLAPDYVILYVGINDADFTRSGLNEGYILDEDSKRGLAKPEIVKLLLPIYKLIQSYLDNKAYVLHNLKDYHLENYIVRDLHENTQELAKASALAFRARFETIINGVKKMGATPVCVSQPHNYTRTIEGEIKGIANAFGDDFSGLDYDYSIRQLNAVMAELCGDFFLDLYNQNFPSAYFYDAEHTTEQGSIYIGNLMADFFIKNNLHMNISD